jgi:His-Xaa-Ser repeat protein HxsA
LKKRLFAIPSLLAAGFFPVEANALPTVSLSLGQSDGHSLFDVFKLDHHFTLAGHRSHSSHSSHSSHRSSAGGTVYSSPVYRDPSPSYAAPLYQPPAVTPRVAPLKVLPGNSAKFTDIVLEVQFAMLAFGYYNGELDGVFNPEMTAALTKLQSDYGLKVTGTITPETLDSLKIVAQ